ncbi:NAD(P)-dependent oxidoreductase [Halegenticoccus soli]|uniref:NAD(P)-dependent oxidoreductase n=1 Tax=Halegenticoccus soli TaxID=1985678 RepID=UPI001E286311|nr:NAD(P)-dependent oxidoreductase [Halegenticoccus soli]
MSSDAVVVTAELTDETCGMMDAAAFDRMRSNATLVNTARGPIVDTAALVNALDDGRIAGAGLDVFETEPLPPDSPLHDRESVVLTPHMGASSVRARVRIIDTLVASVAAALERRPVDDRFVAVPPGSRLGPSRND